MPGYYGDFTTNNGVEYLTATKSENKTDGIRTKNGLPQRSDNIFKYQIETEIEEPYSYYLPDLQYDLHRKRSIKLFKKIIKSMMI